MKKQHENKGLLPSLNATGFLEKSRPLTEQRWLRFLLMSPRLDQHRKRRHHGSGRRWKCEDKGTWRKVKRDVIPEWVSRREKNYRGKLGGNLQGWFRWVAVTDVRDDIPFCAFLPSHLGVTQDHSLWEELILKKITWSTFLRPTSYPLQFISWGNGSMHH